MWWTIIAVPVVLWLLGLSFHVGGGHSDYAVAGAAVTSACWKAGGGGLAGSRA